MKILTRNYSVHNSSVCLTEKGRLRFFIEEERLDRIKHYKHTKTIGHGNLEISKGIMNRFQKGHLYCCHKAGISPELYYSLHDIPLNEFFSHHLAHAAASFYASPFEEAYILTLDGMGAEYEGDKRNFQTSGWYYADKKGIKKLKSLNFPNSMGLFYAAFTDFVNLGAFAEGKLMGLAPYGDERFDKEILSMVKLKEDGSFSIEKDYFDFTTEDSLQYINEDITMSTSIYFERIFGEKRKDQKFINGHFEHLAHSAQNTLEKVVLNMLKAIPDKDFNLCMGGGVFLNCPVNSLLRRQPQVKDTFIFPAADDSGLSYGYNMLLYNELKCLSEDEYIDFLQLLYFDSNNEFFNDYLGYEENFIKIINKINSKELKKYLFECLDTFKGKKVIYKSKAKNINKEYPQELIEDSKKMEFLKKTFEDGDLKSCLDMLKDPNIKMLSKDLGFLSEIITKIFIESEEFRDKALILLKENLKFMRIYQIRKISAKIANDNMQDIISDFEIELIEKRKDRDLKLFLLYLYKMLDKKNNFLSLWNSDFRYIEDLFFYMIRAAWNQKEYDHILFDKKALERVNNNELLWILCQIFFELGDHKSSEYFLNKIPDLDFDQQVMREILESVNSEQ
ncbi:MAG: hypothetical protein C0601_05315 [Candidatus Muiribacterium halophilum]|uniref:Carbamoyltransferase domain-containing protein n=1 Tax=Muiribacterium halophilum TaxID=2053465 RepID=A0A2N5ZHK1_MUIH1|nr:MAG: hypothetical protein C0601_05315 [Candidatus Muirbacterium halophilum]